MKDLIIIGVGPAGLTAAIYTSRYNLKSVVLGEETGGCMNETYNIENYPGIEKISGFELGNKMKVHAEKLGSEIKQEKVNSLEKEENGFTVKTSSGEYKAKRVLLATGTVFRKLGIPGEEEFSGRGVSYCATCDGPFFKGKKVAVIGGGNSALNAALLLSRYAKEVAVFFRADKPSAIPSYVKSTEEKENIVLVPNTNLTEIKGDNKVSGIVLDNDWKEKGEHLMDGVFIEIGSRPDDEVFKNLSLEIDESGYIKVNPDQSTSVEGVFAAGDITTNSNGYRQIITACSEGSIAAATISDLIEKEKSLE